MHNFFASIRRIIWLACYLFGPIFLTIAFMLVLSSMAHCQRVNVFYANQSKRPTVGAKVDEMQKLCNPNMQCYIVIDSDLEVFAEGTMPPRCAKCTWQDFRSGTTYTTQFNVEYVTSTKVSPIPFKSALVFAGDSICANEPVYRWSDLIMNLSAFSGRVIANHNTCVSGYTIADMTADYAAHVAIYKPSVTHITPTYLFVAVGSNNVSDGALGPDASYTAVQAYWAQAKADGFTVVAFTVLPRGDAGTSAYNSNGVEAYNSKVRSSAPGSFDYLIDENNIFADPYDTLLFNAADSTHPTRAGQAMIAAYVNEVFGGPTAMRAPFTGRRGSYNFSCDITGIPPYLNTGTFNSACGVRALPVNTTGSYNAGIGADALSANTTGNYNSALGSQALWKNTTGANNTAVGANASFNALTASDTTAMGFESLMANTADGATAVGSKAGMYNSTGANFTAFGYLAGYLNSTGNYNSALGYGALQNNSTGNNNTAVGNLALNHSTASDNTSVGYSALLTNTTGTGNSALGSGALKNNDTGSYNTAVGMNSGYHFTGNYGTAVGYAAAQNATGGDITALGFEALFTNTTGADNVAVGSTAMFGNTTGSQNVAIGSQAGKFQSDGTTALIPNGSTYIGYGTRGKNNSDSNTTVIGQGAISQGANTVTLGNASVTQLAVANGKVSWFIGTGVPSSALCVSGNIGSIYSNVSGGASTTLYVCTAAATWTAK